MNEKMIFAYSKIITQTQTRMKKKEERKSSLTKNNTQKTVFLYSYFVKGWCIIVIANENGKMENGKK